MPNRMIQKIEVGGRHEVFAEPTPLGLIGLAFGCAALTPIAFGHALTPAGLRTAAMFCLLFGCGCQHLAGLMNFANKNLFGGTVLTAFSFSWALNAWALFSTASGAPLDHEILLATDSAALLVFLVITYGFGFFSSLLFVFLVDVDLIYACKVAAAVSGTKALALPIAVLTVLLGLISLWIAFASLINPTSGRTIFKVPGPMWQPQKKQGFDWSVRNGIFEVLFQHFSKHAFKTITFEDLKARMAARVGDRNILPDLAYLMELGAIVVTTENDEVVNVRLSAEGVDLYEQLILKKYDF